MSALMIDRITVMDPAKFQDYLTKSKAVAATYGAELVYRGTVNRTLNGGDDHAIVVIAKSPSAEKISEWYDSDAYQPLKALRDEGTDMHMTSYEVTG